MQIELYALIHSKKKLNFVLGSRPVEPEHGMSLIKRPYSGCSLAASSIKYFKIIMAGQELIYLFIYSFGLAFTFNNLSFVTLLNAGSSINEFDICSSYYSIRKC